MNYQSSNFREGVTKECPTCGHIKETAPISFDNKAGIALCEGVFVHVTPMQALIMREMVEVYPQILPMERMITSVYGHRVIDDPAMSIRVTIHRLRKALRGARFPFAIRATHVGRGGGGGYWLERGQ